MLLLRVNVFNMYAFVQFLKVNLYINGYDTDNVLNIISLLSFATRVCSAKIQCCVLM